MAYKWGLITTYKSWDDPPSIDSKNHPPTVTQRVKSVNSTISAEEENLMAFYAFFALHLTEIRGKKTKNTSLDFLK